MPGASGLQQHEAHVASEPIYSVIASSLDRKYAAGHMTCPVADCDFEIQFDEQRTTGSNLATYVDTGKASVWKGVERDSPTLAAAWRTILLKPRGHGAHGRAPRVHLSSENVFMTITFPWCLRGAFASPRLAQCNSRRDSTNASPRATSHKYVRVRNRRIIRRLSVVMHTLRSHSSLVNTCVRAEA